jgi:hypothetical protein
MLRSTIELGLACAAIATSCGAAIAAPSWPDTFLARVEALALVETLNANLLGSRSATQTLTDWCALHQMAETPTIVAHLQRGVAKEITSDQRHTLDIGPNEPVIYRRVYLSCGAHVLSQADNWYVPARLTPAMNAALLSSDVPFGRVVQPLHPRRQTLSVTMRWHVLPPDWEMHAPAPDHPQHEIGMPQILFEHRAIVSANGRPISEVDESYTSAILDFQPH